MKRVIITGGTGFVGANLARKLLESGCEVHMLVRPGYTPWRINSIRHEVHLWETELVDGERLKSIAATIRPEWVFHLAAYGAYPFQQDLHAMLQTNVIGTVNMVEACLIAGFEAFIYAGSSSEYGQKDHAPNEQEWLEPNSDYAVTKASATLYCRQTAQKKGVNLYTLRLYSAYGPYEEPSRLIPALITSGLQKKLPPLANPHTSRDFIFVEDVCQAFLLTAARPGQEPGAVYNVGSGVQLSLREVVEIARGLMGIPEEPAWGSMPDRTWDTAVWVADPRLIQSQVGWVPVTNFEQGLKRTIDWLLENPALLAFYRERPG